MGELFILGGLLIFFSVPIITARLAKRLGRKPWLWFFIGMALPAIASLILCLLPDLSDLENSNVTHDLLNEERTKKRN